MVDCINIEVFLKFFCEKINNTINNLTLFISAIFILIFSQNIVSTCKYVNGLLNKQFQQILKFASI